MRYLATDRPSGGSCPAQLTDAVAWAQGIPAFLVNAWHLTLVGRAQLGPLALAALMTPILGQAIGAEVVAFIAVRILRANCTVAGLVSDEVGFARMVLGVVSRFLPAELRDAVNRVLDVLDGRGSPEDLCYAVRAFAPYLSVKIPLPPCPSSAPASTSQPSLVSNLIRWRSSQPSAQPSPGPSPSPSPSKPSYLGPVLALAGLASAAGLAFTLSRRSRRRS